MSLDIPFWLVVGFFVLEVVKLGLRSWTFLLNRRLKKLRIAQEKAITRDVLKVKGLTPNQARRKRQRGKK